MGECRFDGSCCQAHYGFHALCTHAAADLARRLAGVMVWLTRHQPPGSPPPGDEVRLAGWIVTELESRLARLELEAQTYAEVAAGFQQEKARLEEEKAQLQGDLRVERRLHESATRVIEAIETAADGQLPEHYTEDNATIVGEVYRIQQRLAQAEAREAAMREALQDIASATEDDMLEFRDLVRTAEAALSPDAGRAPVEER